MKEYLIRLLLSGLAVFAPIKGVLITTGILIFIDLISGVIAAKKRGENISSAKLRNTVTKCLIYQTAILSGFLVETYMLSGVLPVSKLVAGVIGVTETKSVFENFDAILGQNLFKALVEKLGSSNLPPKDPQ
jgi:hypothetical protein